MAKDAIGNKIKVGDKLFLNGFVYNVKDLQENRVIGGQSMTGNKITGMKIPDSITLEIDIPFDGDKPINGFVVKNPENDVDKTAIN